MIAIGLAMVMNFLLPLMVAIIFLFRTEKVLSIIKIKEQDQINLNIDKQVLYHMIIIVFGFVVLLHGTGNFIEVNYKTDTKMEYNTNNVSYGNQTPVAKQEMIYVTNSKSKNVNYFALIEIFLGIILLTKATAISKKIENNFDSNTGRTTEENKN